MATDPNTTTVLIRSDVHASTRILGKWAKDEPHLTVSLKNRIQEEEKTHETSHGYTIALDDYTLARSVPSKYIKRDDTKDQDGNDIWPGGLQTEIVMHATAGAPTDNPTGSYFLDLDPDIFTHVLRFLRAGLYPICYDGAKGHDVAAYAAIAAQAAYLGVPKLCDWVDGRRYLKAVTRESSAKIVEGEDGLRGVQGADTKVRYHPFWKTEKNYVCPRGIAVHYGSPGKCGRACKQAQGDAEDEYEDCEVLKTLVVTEKTVFDWQVCVDAEG
ncbi:MAG: hypothetical protein Q9173_002753 [Seirophora scorigena]